MADRDHIDPRKSSELQISSTNELDILSTVLAAIVTIAAIIALTILGIHGSSKRQSRSNASCEFCTAPQKRQVP